MQIHEFIDSIGIALTDLLPLSQNQNTRKATFQTLKNLFLGTTPLETTSQEVSGAINEINTSLSELTNKLLDSGWVNIPLTANTTPNITTPPIMRKIGNELTLNGRFSIADISLSVFTLPSGYIPSKIQMKNVPLNDTHGYYAVIAFLTDGSVMLYLPSSQAFTTSLQFRCDTEIILD